MLFPRQIEEAILRVDGASENYRIVKLVQGPFTGLRVLVEPTPARLAAGDLGSFVDRIVREIYSMVGVRVEVEAVAPGSLPRSEGKAKRVAEE